MCVHKVQNGRGQRVDIDFERIDGGLSFFVEQFCGSLTFNNSPQKKQTDRGGEKDREREGYLPGAMNTGVPRPRYL